MTGDETDRESTLDETTGGVPSKPWLGANPTILGLPQTPEFSALRPGLALNFETKSGWAGAEHPRQSRLPDRRSGRSPALPYPPSGY